MATLKLAASNIGWAKEDDAIVYAKMKELGYTGLEIAPTRIFPAPAYDYIRQVPLFAAYIYQEYGFTIPSMQSILNGKTENLFDEAGAYSLTATLDEAFHFARACRCENLVFGCPRNRSIPEGLSPEAADAFFGECGTLAAKQEVTLALETVPPCYNTNFLNNTADTFAYVKRLGAPGLSVNLDIGAMLTNGEKLADIVNDLSLVSHVHISEPGLAPVVEHSIHKELALLLKGLGYQGYVSVEMKTTDAATMCESLAYVASVFGGE
ncbi:MAG: sugar phosphate isomerase/epimerase family protein [Faecalibacterium sp.]